MIVVGDIGGTKTVLAEVEESAGPPRLGREEIYRSSEHASFQDILERFLATRSRTATRAVCLGVAGVVREGRVRTTNLPWEICEDELRTALGGAPVKLLNDLEATAYGTLFLPEAERVVLQVGATPKPRGNVAVIAAGTGLGEAFLYWDGNAHHPIATEGGHGDFAPRSEREIEFYRHLRREIGDHVSYERVVSGPGLTSLYEFLRGASEAPEPAWLTERIRREDPSAVVAELGLAAEDPVCAEALDLFASLYGAEAGNMALRCLAFGGVVLCGGIAPKILPALESGTFIQSFLDKGRFSDLLSGIEVSVAVNPRTPLLGCAHYALRLGVAGDR
jgi:glucokinase